MEGTEIRQRGRCSGEGDHLGPVGGASARAHLGELFLEVTDEFDEYFDEVRHSAAGGADGGHEEQGVAGGLVDLDAVLVHQVPVLEGVSVDTG
jgi:hypothetical protein